MYISLCVSYFPFFIFCHVYSSICFQNLGQIISYFFTYHVWSALLPSLKQDKMNFTFIGNVKEVRNTVSLLAVGDWVKATGALFILRAVFISWYRADIQKVWTEPWYCLSYLVSWCWSVCSDWLNACAILAVEYFEYHPWPIVWIWHPFWWHPAPH